LNARRRVVVVGAGPGALSAVARLRERGGDAADIVLIAPGRRATFLAGTLDVALGEAAPDRFTTDVELEAVRCIDGEVEAVAPDGVVVRDERIIADAVIAAPGLALALDVAAGWPRAVAAWDLESAHRARAAMPEVKGGRVVIAACSLPYRCPPAPFALAIRLKEQHFRARRLTKFVVATPEPMPLAGVGGDAPALVMEACTAAGIDVERGFVVDLKASDDGTLRASDGRELRYDAAFLVPPHVRARCLSGLPGDGPLVSVGARGSVDGTTLHVVGDAAATDLPRAAGIARGTGAAAADGVLEALEIAPAPAPEPLEAVCFMYHYGGAVSRLRVTYEPSGSRVAIDGPSLDLAPAREGERRRFLAAARDAG
jgi:sulfide:quinone oxidoreductase